MDPVVFCTKCGSDVDFMDALKSTCLCEGSAMASWILDPSPRYEDLLYQKLIFSNNFIIMGQNASFFRDQSFQIFGYTYEES